MSINDWKSLAHRAIRSLTVSVCSVLAIIAVFALVGCGKTPQTSGGMSDELFKDTVTDDLFYVFQYGDTTFTVADPVPVNIAGVMPLEDGKFYRVVADVTYLNGGVAGYVNFPQVDRVSSCEEVSPFSIGLRSIEDRFYGVTLVGDYADGDVFALESGVMALWKDGNWVYRYDKMDMLDDGTYVCYRSGIAKDDIIAGRDSGTIACEDYFVLPPVSH